MHPCIFTSLTGPSSNAAPLIRSAFFEKRAGTAIRGGSIEKGVLGT